MERLIKKEVVNIPAINPVIAFKRFQANMYSPYRNNQFEVGKEYHNPLFTIDSLCEGFFTFENEESDIWDGKILAKVAIWGKVMYINSSNIESEYIKIISILRTT